VNPKNQWVPIYNRTFSFKNDSGLFLYLFIHFRLYPQPHHQKAHMLLPERPPAKPLPASRIPPALSSTAPGEIDTGQDFSCCPDLLPPYLKYGTVFSRKAPIEF
jgi:hypothetical protein